MTTDAEIETFRRTLILEQYLESKKKETTTTMSLPGTKLNSDPCLDCNHPRSAHDPYVDSCVGGSGGCRCEGFVERDEADGEDGEDDAS